MMFSNLAGQKLLVLGFLVATLCFQSVLPVSVDAGQANVFIYHRFGEDRYPSTNIDIALFSSHMEYLGESGRPVWPLSRIVDALRSGQGIPEDVVAITVDDAFDSFLEKAMPIIRQYNFPVTLFVNTDGVGDPGYLDWDQLRELYREGVDIGNHTATHDYLIERRNGESRSAWEERVRQDIAKAQRAFERELGYSPPLFAYPYGEYSPRLQVIVEDLGFRAGIAQQSGVVSAASHLFALPRFPMGGPYANLASFRSKASMRPLDLKVLSPDTPLIQKAQSPELRVQITPDTYDLGRLQGFVQGGNRLVIDVNQKTGIVTVKAEKPLSGRRNKYTLTVPLKKGGGWAWFSQPWFKPKSTF